MNTTCRSITRYLFLGYTQYQFFLNFFYFLQGSEWVLQACFLGKFYLTTILLAFGTLCLFYHALLVYCLRCLLQLLQLHCSFFYLQLILFNAEPLSIFVVVGKLLTRCQNSLILTTQPHKDAEKVLFVHIYIFFDRLQLHEYFITEQSKVYEVMDNIVIQLCTEYST